MLALAYSVVVPPFEGLDEIEHFGVTRYVAQAGQLPVQGDPALEVYHARQEASQPPLYYLVAGSLLRLSRISTADTNQYLVPNPYVTCGTGNIGHNKKCASPRSICRGVSLAWRAARAASDPHWVHRASSIYRGWRVRDRAPGYARPLQHGRPGCLAYRVQSTVPHHRKLGQQRQHRHAHHHLGVYLCVVVAQEGKGYWVLGILIGLAALSKLTGLLLLPLVALAWLGNFKSAHRKPNASREIRNLIALGIVTLTMSGWWYIRNFQLYGDPTGLALCSILWGGVSQSPLGCCSPS